MNTVKEIAESSLKYSLSTEKDEYGISPAEIYSSVFDYLESNVTNLYGIRRLLLEDGITIPPQLEEECERVLGLNERHYKYSLYIEPILAVNDLPDRLASPTKAERVQYEKLRADSEEKSKKEQEWTIVCSRILPNPRSSVGQEANKKPRNRTISRL